MKNRSAYHLPLMLLFAFAVLYQAQFTVKRVQRLLSATELARAPFTLSPFSNVIASLRPEAEEAGLRRGDALLSINGRAYTGAGVPADALKAARPGDPLSVAIKRAEAGVEESVAIQLAPAATARPTAGEWLFEAMLVLAMPVFCLLLGFLVAALRPRDPLAWLLLALLLSFGQLLSGFDAGAWSGWFRNAALFYYTFFESSWGLWMMLFGIYFPEKWVVDRRWPWAKWLLAVPLIFFVVKDLILAFGRMNNFAAVAPLYQMYRPFGFAEGIVSMVAIGIFFAALAYKAGAATAADARRRLWLLYAGSSVSLVPVFLVVIYGLASGTAFGAGLPAWVLLPALALLFLFPLTLAYVIVVHRALDVRVVIRQGVQYTFARGGAVVVSFLIIAAIIFVMVWQVSQPGTRLVESIIIISVGLALILMMRRMGERVARVIDRRFFREAYNAEQILSELSEKVRTMVETEPLLETVAARISESLHVPRVALLLETDGAYRPAHAVGYREVPEVSFPRGAETLSHMRRASEPVRVYLDDRDSWVNRTPGLDGERSMLESLDTQLLLPLVVRERMPGFISLGPKQSEEPYSKTDLRLLQSVATQAGLALENSYLTAAIASEVAQRERLNRELEIAREVQERLFPQKLPSIMGLDYCGACRPALGVGGDYYDFLLLPGDTFGIAIGDVSGKGIAAALLMASLQASLRGQAILGADDIAVLMSSINRLVYDASAENRYATFFYAQYDPATRNLTYVNAGHNPPVILRRSAEGWQCIRLDVGGAVVGLLRNFAYHQATVTLETGDALIAFTDGISEAMDPDNEEWGEDNLIEAAKDCSGLSAADTIKRLVEAADRFASGAKQHDDMTLVVVRAV